ncbi:hypothetical protein BAG01nite_13830 [Brevibacillus agri]|uniref:Uncharacterized protein n=1 Tax=Brevibacillus agri TaxID=51101 RepID=A0ABQ0SN59_9BACL|nr:hypothetical protein BAG01nite_13830 [Brevibacillus agri]
MNSYLTLQQSFCTTRYASEKKNGKSTPKEQNSQNKAKYNRNPHKQKPGKALAQTAAAAPTPERKTTNISWSNKGIVVVKAMQVTPLCFF